MHKTSKEFYFRAGYGGTSLKSQLLRRQRQEDHHPKACPRRKVM
jgi:hypothetical protein